MMSRRKAGFTVVETMIALAVLLYAAIAFFTTYQKTVSQEVQSQNRNLAMRVARSSLAEWRDHPFGSAPCSDWGFPTSKDKQSNWVLALPATLVVEGRRVSQDFHVQRSVQSGALFGQADGDYDVVTTVVSWTEGRQRTPMDYGPFTNSYFEKDDQHVVVQIPVWR